MSSFFTLKYSKCNCSMLVKCFETFWNCRSTLSSHRLKVWSSIWQELCNILRVGVSCVGFAPAFCPVTAGILCITPCYQLLLSRVCLKVITMHCLADLTLHLVNKKSLLQLAAITDIWHWDNCKFVLNLHGLTNCHWQSKSSLKPNPAPHSLIFSSSYCCNLCEFKHWQWY